MTSIGDRLREFRKRTGVKMPVISSATGIQKETLYKWEKGTKPSSIENYSKLKTYLDKEDNRPADEDFEFETSKPPIARLPLSHAGPAVLQADGKATNGSIIFANGEPELIVNRISAPFLGAVEGIIEFTGSATEPNIPKGSSVAITRLQNFRCLEWGQYYYIIDMNWQSIVRRIYQGYTEGYVQLISDNPDQDLFPPYQLGWDDIKAILKIVAVIFKY